MGLIVRILRQLAAPAATIAACFACAAPVQALVPAQPIPEGPEASSVPAFLGAPAKPKAVQAPSVPRHPFMAANGRSNIHDDAYMTDTYTGPGPLGRDMRAHLDVPGRRMRVGDVRPRGPDRGGVRRARRPRLVLLDPQTLDLLAAFDLPPAP